MVTERKGLFQEKKKKVVIESELLLLWKASREYNWFHEGHTSMGFSPAKQARWVSIHPESQVHKLRLTLRRAVAATLQPRRVSRRAD